MAKRHEDWQVKQADTALRLYDYFLSKSFSPKSEELSSHEERWKLLEEKMREALRLRHRSLSTEKTYLIWFRNFRVLVGEKEPGELQGRDLQDFLSHLAVEKKVSSSTQNQALNAIVFLYRHVLGKNIDQELSAVRAKQRRHLPAVLTLKEIESIFGQLSGTLRLMAMLIYGCGLRLHECLQWRVRDIDIEQNIVIVRSGKGDKDRKTVLPEVLKDDLIRHLSEIRSIYDQDRRNEINSVWLPGHWRRNIPMPGSNGGGSGFSHRSRSLSIRGLTLLGDTMFIPYYCRRRSRLLWGKQALQSKPP